jgi:hypothetical protein
MLHKSLQALCHFLRRKSEALPIVKIPKPVVQELERRRLLSGAPAITLGVHGSLGSLARQQTTPSLLANL